MTEGLLATNTQPTDQGESTSKLVGPGKKFATYELLETAKENSDAYIKVLESQMDRLREDFLKERSENQLRARVDDLMSNQPQLASSAQPQANEVTQKPVDTRQIEALVDNRVRQMDTERRKTENLNLVRAQLQEQYGAEYAKVLDSKMKELDLSPDQVNELAKTAPKAFMNTMGLNQQRQQEGFQTPPRNSTRSESFKPQGEPKRSWSYYEDLYKKDPRAFYDPQTNVQMVKDAIALGDSFNDGTFERPAPIRR